MATIKKFEDLEIWKMARGLCQNVDSFIKRKGLAQDFKLVNQINGSSGSVMDNIAEGFDRGSRKEFIQFLGIAKGSNGEVKSQLYRSLDRNYISQEEFNLTYSLSDTIGKKIHGLIHYLNTTEVKGQKYLNRVEEPIQEYAALSFDFNDNLL